jgi:hypothetical protein
VSSILVNRRNALCLFGAAALASRTSHGAADADVKRTDGYFTTSDGIKLHCGADIVILSGRSHLTTVSDPRYREAMVRFIDAHT